VQSAWNMPNPQFHPDAPFKSTTRFAKRLLVVSGGSMGSPLILERSGIGAAAVLEKYGVRQVVDLPGVGERYQDHQLDVPACYASDESETPDDLYREEPDQVESKCVPLAKIPQVAIQNGQRSGSRTGVG